MSSMNNCSNTNNNIINNTNGNIGKKMENLLNKKTVQKLKVISGPVGLLTVLMIYTIVGGLIFRQLELPSETKKLSKIYDDLLIQRRRLINRILNTTDIQIINRKKIIDFELGRYEQVMQDAYQDGFRMADTLIEINSFNISNIDENTFAPFVTNHWSILQAVFFASTVLTTIGYGNVVPVTIWGRIFCISFAFIGIPLTLTVIADWGKLFAEIVSELASKLSQRFPALFEFWLPHNTTGRRSLGAFAAVLLLFFYLSCGAGMFMLWENDWNFFDGFYFCFVTMTTIGFGDLVPKKPNYMLFCSLYILVGLAITGTIIELVRKQYVQSWHRLQALRGPLAEALRRIGDQAGGDVSSFQTDLRKILTVISMPKLRSKNGELKEINDEGWQEAIEAILRDIAITPKDNSNKSVYQIIIYESNV